MHILTAAIHVNILLPDSLRWYERPGFVKNANMYECVSTSKVTVIVVL